MYVLFVNLFMCMELTAIQILEEGKAFELGKCPVPIHSSTARLLLGQMSRNGYICTTGSLNIEWTANDL